MLRVLFLIENVPFSLDSRVQRQSGTLQASGATIFVVCPKGQGESFHYVANGVHIYQYWKPSLGAGLTAHLVEYAVSLSCHALLSAFIVFRHGIDVIHITNPPDLLWLIAAPYRLLGKPFIYDQHDLVPELFEVRYKDRFKWLTRLTYGLERWSYRLSNHVIVTNDTFKHHAVHRGRKHPEDVTIVRNGPRLSRDFPHVEPDPAIRGLNSFVIGYLGIMNPQDHLDVFLEMARIVRIQHRRSDVSFLMVGSGDSFAELQRLRDRKGLADAVHMTGSVPWPQVLAALSATDICIQPDPPTAFNRHLTMNKLMEYMALGKAVVAFDMPETRVSGADCVVYADGESPESLADAVLSLLGDLERMRALGLKARRRVEDVLAWEHQAGNLLKAYERLFPGILEGDSSQASSEVGG